MNEARFSKDAVSYSFREKSLVRPAINRDYAIENHKVIPRISMISCGEGTSNPRHRPKFKGATTELAPTEINSVATIEKNVRTVEDPVEFTSI